MDNLTKDCIRAMELGYKSYGRYKADYPHTKDVVEVAEPEEQLPVCPVCQVAFCPPRKGVIYCSKRCQNREMSRRRQRRLKGLQV